MHLNDTPQSIISYLSIDLPEIPQVISKARSLTKAYKGSVQDYQAAVLYALANRYNKPNTTILEIGTGLGFTASVMSMACPLGFIRTVNPNILEWQIAQELDRELKNIEFVHSSSRQEMPQRYIPTPSVTLYYDLIFIDGDHKDIEFDLTWIEYLKPNGTIVFHDYSDETSKSPCLPVYKCLTAFSSLTPFDILVKDTENNYGMAGWIKNETVSGS